MAKAKKKKMIKRKDGSYCNEPLHEEEIEFYNTQVDAMPLCTNCGIKLW